MFGLEVLLPFVIEKVVDKFAGSPETAQALAQAVVDNPGAAMVVTGSPVLAGLGWIVYKVWKTPEKMLKFRKFLRKFRRVGHQVLDQADALDKKLEDECAGGVCELPEDK